MIYFYDAIFNDEFGKVFGSMGSTKNQVKMAKRMIKYLNDGKVKLSKDVRINLSASINNSIENSIVSKLDGIISKENVVVEQEELTTAKKVVALGTQTNALKQYMDKEFYSGEISSQKRQTVIVSLKRSEVLDAFDWTEFSTIGNLLRTTTLSGVYTKLKESWKSIIKSQNKSMTDVMYIPNLIRFVSDKTGELMKHYQIFNLLIVVTPSNKDIEDATEDALSTEDYIGTIIADQMDAAIKCGARNVIIAPFDNPTLKKHPYESAELWKKLLESDRVNDNVDTITFTVEEDDEFIIVKNNILK